MIIVKKKREGRYIVRKKKKSRNILFPSFPMATCIHHVSLHPCVCISFFFFQHIFFPFFFLNIFSVLVFKKSGPCYFLSLSLSPLFLDRLPLLCILYMEMFLLLIFWAFAAPPPKAFHVEAREEKLQAFNIQTSRALSLIGTRLPSKKPSGDDQPSFFLMLAPSSHAELARARSGEGLGEKWSVGQLTLSLFGWFTTLRCLFNIFLWTCASHYHLLDLCLLRKKKERTNTLDYYTQLCAH